jgi:hypothetical protein
VSEHREEILISFIKLLQDKKKEWVMEEKKRMRKEQKEKRRWWSFRKRESGAEYRGGEGERKPWKKHVRREKKEAHVF